MTKTLHEGYHHHTSDNGERVPAEAAGGEGFEQVLPSTPFLLAAAAYAVAAALSARRYSSWPRHRMICWLLGVGAAAAAVIGPLAAAAHHSFEAHMATHLLLGMMAPLLLVLSAPLTLALRTLPVAHARRLSAVLRSAPLQLVIHPVTAAALNVGGLALLYLTELYTLMHEHVWIYILVHLHIFLAGYAFTASMLYTDPVPHRKSYMYRSIVLVLAIAGHGILAKYLYAHPPAGVMPDEAEAGSMLMYYGGDLVHLAVIFLLCRQWYRSAGRALLRGTKSTSHG
ncbi:cytochrome c oxidase assembly protein [Paenibacillus sp. 1P07SE]|uniref:cytochrome c oxidase assembly protein n=1 Tax=Paenibacillus sp. 1P07SE TaxID=3132209 RepID=UPI0039A7158E